MRKKLISIILIAIFLSASLSANVKAEGSISGYSGGMDGLIYILAGIGLVGFVIIDAPNLFPYPMSVSTGEVFAMRAFPPLHPWTEFHYLAPFSIVDKQAGLLTKTYYVKAPSQRGRYSYQKDCWNISLGYRISVLSDTETRGGVANPTPQDFNRQPLMGMALQSIGSIIGLGYFYADEMPKDEFLPWQGIKSFLLGAMSYYVYSQELKHGNNIFNNPGSYLLLGTTAFTSWDVFRIINTKNEYAKELRFEDMKKLQNKLGGQL